MERLVYLIPILLVIGLVPLAHAESLNHIARITFFEDTTTADSTFDDYTIDPPLNDVSKTITFINFQHTFQNDFADTVKRFKIINESTLRIYGDGSAGTGNNAVDFRVEFFEFDEESPIQVTWEEFEVGPNDPDIDTGAGLDVTLATSVNSTNSIILTAGMNVNGTDTSFGLEEFAEVEFVNDSEINLKVGNNQDAGDTMYGFQIVDFNDPQVLIQTGSDTFPDGDSALSVAPTGSPDFTRSWLFFTYSVDPIAPFSLDHFSHGLRGQLCVSGGGCTFTSDGEIEFDREGTLEDLYIDWQLVTFPVGFMEVQHGDIQLTDGESTQTETINTIDTDCGCVIGSTMTPSGFGSSEGGDDPNTAGAWDRVSFFYELDDSTTVRVTRADSAEDARIAYMATEFLAGDGIPLMDCKSEVGTSGLSYADSTLLLLQGIYNNFLTLIGVE